MRSKVKFLITIGESGKMIENAFDDLMSVYMARDLQDALRVARGVSKSGDTVLLSPACASFDMFRNYQDRGQQFKRIVDSWQDEHSLAAKS